MAEQSGLGVAIEIEDSLPTEKVWAVLLQKIQRPQDYLPVTDVVTRPSDVSYSSIFFAIYIWTKVFLFFYIIFCFCFFCRTEREHIAK